MGNCCLSSISVETQTTEPAVDLRQMYLRSTMDNTEEYTLKGLRTLVKVLRVLDGDTLDIALYHSESKQIKRHRVRLQGLDTPEIHPLRSNPLREQEKKAGLEAKEALEKRLEAMDWMVSCEFHGGDKYGRELCTLYDIHQGNIAEWMIEKGYGYRYDGGKKQLFQPKSPLE